MILQSNFGKWRVGPRKYESVNFLTGSLINIENHLTAGIISDEKKKKKSSVRKNENFCPFSQLSYTKEISEWLCFDLWYLSVRNRLLVRVWLLAVYGSDHVKREPQNVERNNRFSLAQQEAEVGGIKFQSPRSL